MKSEEKPAEATPAAVPTAAEPQVVNNSPSPTSTDLQETTETVATPTGQQTTTAYAVPGTTLQQGTQTVYPGTSQSTGATTTGQSQGYEMVAQKVDPNAPPSPPAQPAPYPPYQGYQAPPPGYAPSPYGGYPAPPPKKYVPPGPIESTGEFIGHLVNPFKRKEDESKKEYKGI